MIWVDKILTKIHSTIPKAVRMRGYIRLATYTLHPFCDPINSVEDITSAAHVDYANEPNKSALMPATSPTLSPTLSAIVAGFFGLSSGNPASTFPTKSAPTSAALVYIPPPTLPNKATKDPPRPYPAIASNKGPYLSFCG